MAKASADTVLSGEHRATLLKEVLRSVSFFLPDQFPHRVNVMQPIMDGTWRIMHQVGMDDDRDLAIAIEPGEGATGQAVVNKVQVFQRLEDIFTTVSKLEADKVRPSLRWILSTPIVRRSRGADAIGVVNVDSTKDLGDGDLDRLSRGVCLIANTLAELLVSESNAGRRVS